jgi:AcrR family transcriptional regulator
MFPQVKAKPDDTKARIIETADALFRRLGYAKTAVSDIAAELGMSPANIYRFFSSKNAIVEAICKRCLTEVEDKAWAVARSKASASDRLERVVLEILAYHKENLITDQRVNDIVLVAMEDSWQTIQAHKVAMCAIAEMILRDGIASGEFEQVDPHRTADLFMRSVLAFTHPLLIGKCLEEGQAVEDEARASVRFLLRAITPR